MTTLRVMTVGLAEYRKRSVWSVDEATRSRDKVESLLRAHGAVPEDWTGRATTGQIAGQLTKWAKRWDESQILYWTGHGEFNDDGYFLALADSEELAANDALSDNQLSSALLTLERSRAANGCPEWVLVILDTCGSGAGGWKIWTSFRYPPRNIGVIATTDEGAAYSGAFPKHLEAALDSFTGNDTDGIPLNELLRRLEVVLGADKINSKFEPSAILPNRVDVLPPVQTTVDVYSELRDVLAAAPPEIRNHFYTKAQSSEIGEPAWNFVGRETERRDIAAWLRHARGGMFVVSGIAGSGKSALLGMMLATSDPQVRAALVAAGHTSIPHDLHPGDLTYHALLHLRGQTILETVSSLAIALGLEPVDGPDALLDHARQHRQPPARTTLLVDALDEARDPLTIAALLRRLAALPGYRVLIGTRQSLREDPDHTVPPDSDVLDVLAADPHHVLKLGRDPDAVRSYIRARLDRAALPYLTPSRIQDVADRIASEDQPFLFGRLAVHEIIADPSIAQSDTQLADLLSAGHRGIFGRAVARLGSHAADVEALLHLLAYARGSGFPRTDGIWETAASALTSTPITDASITRTLQLAAPYIMHDSEAGQSVYRLAHRAFTEWYQFRATTASPHRTVADCSR